MLTRLITICLSAFLFVSCQLHVNVSGLETQVTLIEVNSGATVTLNGDSELYSFKHEFSAFENYEVEILDSDGQLCHLVYKTGSFSTPYTEMEVNCNPIVSQHSCSPNYYPICARANDLKECTDPEAICDAQVYQTFWNKCLATTSQRSPIFIGLKECHYIEIKGFRTRNIPPITLIDEEEINSNQLITPLTKDNKISIDSAVFSATELTLTFTDNAACEIDEYHLNIEKFEANSTEIDWALQYSRSHCTNTRTLTQTFDLSPIIEWFYQQNGSYTGSVELEGIGTFVF